jgi:DMSO/TMAO reductase YedYZ molybdopterin-dependent catalytic subunit
VAAKRVRSTDRSLRPEFGATLVAGFVALAVTLLLRRAIEAPLFAEVVTDATPALLNPSGFATLLSELGSDGKPLLFLTVLVGQALGFAFLGVLAVQYYVRLRPMLPDDAPPALRYRATFWAFVGLLVVLVTTLIAATLTWTTPAVLPARAGWAELVLTLMASSAVFVAVVVILAPERGGWLSAPESVRRRRDRDAVLDLSRRQMLRLSGGALLGLGSGVVLGRDVWQRRGGGAQRTVRSGPTPEITPTEDFYIISKNLFDPKVPIEQWALSVFGGDQPDFLLRYEELLRRPARDLTVTMQCISNEVGGDLMGNAVWTGFPLRELLEDAGIPEGTQFIAFRSWDGYTESLPLEFALRDSTMLATHMNGLPLSDAHGFPLRLLAPGKYGIKHPKWITEIAFFETEIFGFWQQRGWTQDGRMKTTSRIDQPFAGQTLVDGSVRLDGVAFSGDRAITRVEVSSDRGVSWQEAVLRPPLSPFSWVLWSLDTDVVSDNGRFNLLVRATDGDGALQLLEPRPPDPDGSQGWHAVSVRVTEAAPDDESET